MTLAQPTRAYIYRVAVVVLPLLVALGALRESLVPMIVAVLAAVFIPGLAAANTPTKPAEPPPA